MSALPSSGSARPTWPAPFLAAGLVLAAALFPGAARTQVLAGDWTPNGVVATAGPGEVMSAIPVPDESGGLYVVWTARPVGGTATEVRVRRIYSSGAWDPHWPMDGVLLGPNSGVIGAWRHPSGGLVVADGRRVWRLTSLGAHANGWPAEGKLIEPLTGGQFSVGIDRGGRVWALGATEDGGCIYLPAHPPACWSLIRVYAVRLDQAGDYEPGWEPPGKVVYVGEGEYGARLSPLLKGVPGGVAFAYTDRYYSSSIPSILRVGYVLNDGSAQVGPVEQGFSMYFENVAWDVDAAGAILVTDGQSLSTAAINKHTPNRLWPWPGWRYPASTDFGLTRHIFTDGAGGAYVQSFIALLNLEIHEVVHHVLSSGTADPRWPPAGIELSAGAFAGIASYVATRDGRGGYFATWPQSNGADSDIHAVRLLPDASAPVGWDPAGTPVCNLVGSHQGKPVPAADESGNVFVVWLDARNGPAQVFAQKIGLDSPVPVASASASAELDGGGVRLRWRVLEPASLAVERSTDGVSWSVVSEPEPPTEFREFVDENPVRGEVNQYRLSEESLGWTGGEVSIFVPALAATARLAVVPNPVNRASRVVFSATAPGEVSFGVHDLQGREIAVSATSAGLAGEYELEWDALARLPQGLYWLRMRTPDGESRTVRFVVAP